MHPKSNQQLVLFTLQAILSSIYLPGFFCSSRLQCPDVPFSCGSVRYIGYPFWGGARSESCGRQGFELICYGNVPMLNISSLSYRVNGIDFETNTLKVARQDLWDNTCPKFLQNTTLDPRLFQLSNSSNEQNVILYFGCTVDATYQVPNQFSCGGDDGKTVNLYKAGNSSSGPGLGISCQSNIFVPVNGGAAQSLRNPTASSINILQSPLAAGFSIQWPEEAKQRQAPFCNRNVYGSCIRSGTKIYNQRLCSTTLCRGGDTASNSAPNQPKGTVIYNQTRCRSTAYCSGGHCSSTASCSGGDNASNPAPEPQGSSPGQSPDSAPGPATPRFIPNVKGLSPNQSPVSTHGTQRFSSPKGKGPSLIWIIGGLLLGIICITIVTIKIVPCFKRRRSQSGPKQESNHDFENFLLQQGSLAPKRYKYSEIKKITKSFSDKLGQGGYGSVYKGMLGDGSLVAVKVLIETNSNGEEFINEVASISRTSHVHIVNLLGFCFDKKKRALVYEYMPNKSLDKFISSNADWRLDLEKLYNIAVGVAKGLEYLHSGCNTRIVHFDIKPQNILLDEDLCPKISDFGLAKLGKRKQSILSMLGPRGTIGYIAPEIYSRNFGGASHKSDVYSYGMMILEMAGARKIEEAQATNSCENYFPEKLYEQVVPIGTERLDGTMVEEEEEKSKKMFLVGFWCIQTPPSDRPAMSKVVEMLEGSIQSIQIPPKPTLFGPNSLSGQEISPSFSEYVEIEKFAEDNVET